jgi:hypothetical protein
MNTRSRSTLPYEIALVVLTAICAIGLSIIASRGSMLDGEMSGLLWVFGFVVILVGWVRADRRARGYRAPFEFDAFVFFAWPVAVPYYLCSTRGWRGFLITLGLVALSIVPYFAAGLTYALLAKR